MMFFIEHIRNTSLIHIYALNIYIFYIFNIFVCVHHNTSH